MEESIAIAKDSTGAMSCPNYSPGGADSSAQLAENPQFLACLRKLFSAHRFPKTADSYKSCATAPSPGGCPGLIVLSRSEARLPNATRRCRLAL